MLKNKRPQIAKDYMIPYVGYLHKERTIAHVIVERVSSLKREQQKLLTTTWWTSPRQHWTRIKERCQECWGLNVGPHVDTDGLYPVCQLTFWLCFLCVWTVCHFRISRKLPSKLRTKATIDGPIKFMLIWTNRPLNFNRSAFDVRSSFFE